MDICVGFRIVEYLFILYWSATSGQYVGAWLSTIININRPDGTTYSQTVYVLKYSPCVHVVSATVES